MQLLIVMNRPMQINDVMAEVGKVRWWHCIDLGNGIVTPGECRTNEANLQTYGIPPDLHGKSVLDIGAWDGFYSFAAERRGASRVLATDYFCWGENAWAATGFGTKAGFDLARRALGSKVEELKIDVLDIVPERVGTFDLVLFLGVLYHMRHPLLALERVFSVTANQAIIETHVDMLEIKRPAIAFYPEAELGNDVTNWCGPNPAAVEAMLRSVGFRAVKMTYLQKQSKKLSIEAILSCRAVFHAWR